MTRGGWLALRTRMVPSIALTGFLCLTLTAAGCTWGPIRNVTSLSPAIKADSIDYNDAVGDAADRILLTNILRSRDGAPLNLSQLSSLSGSLTLQGTLGLSLPWGNGKTGMGPSIAQNVGTPSIMGSTSPTYSLTPLNTQAFMLSILQPVSAAYVLSRWQAGLSREMLLRIFVKEIDFPDPSVPGGTFRYVNDPNIDARIDAFDALVNSLVAANAELKAFDILDPVGLPFSLYASTTTTTPAPSASSNTIPKTNADSTAFGQITGANDGQYHVGNMKESEVRYADGSIESVKNGAQLYRVYSAQVALCVDSSRFHDYRIPAINPVLADPENPTDEELQQGVGRAAVIPLLGGANNSGGTQGAQGGAAGAHGGAPASTGGSPTSGQAVTAALQAGRVSALVDARGCRADEIVLNLSDEPTFEKASKDFIHVQWRSVSEIFDYLGAVVRYEERHGSPLQVSTIGDPSIQPPASSSTVANLFHVYQNSNGRLSVHYNGRTFGVNDVNVKDPYGDYTMPILSMMSILVDLSAQPSITSSQPLRLLPIP
jgi:hypothetical protein